MKKTSPTKNATQNSLERIRDLTVATTDTGRRWFLMRPVVGVEWRF
ncbi:MAG: hypothetical protein ABIS29_10710 [Vicinamibacterales bacterium]